MQQELPRKKLIAADVPQYALDFINKIDFSKIEERWGRQQIKKLESLAFSVGKIPKKKGV